MEEETEEEVSRFSYSRIPLLQWSWIIGWTVLLLAPQTCKAIEARTKGEKSIRKQWQFFSDTESYNYCIERRDESLERNLDFVNQFLLDNWNEFT